MKPYRLYIFDLDGTLYRGAEPVPYAVETVRELRQRGAMVRFLTNNSGQTRAAQAIKLSSLGFDASPSEILTSSYAAANYCLENDIRRVFLVGEPGMFSTFESACVMVDQDSERVDAVVVGICRTFTYQILNTALQRLLHGARFIATNTDATYPLAAGKVEPGAGSIVASVQAASGISPHLIGKPNPDMILELVCESGVTPSETLVVGDRIDTDIAAGLAAGCDCHLVLTGVTSDAMSNQGYSISSDLRDLL